MLESWATESHVNTRWKLPYALAKCLKGALLSPILPRLFLILFTYLQPVFIGVAIKFVNGTSDNILGGNSGLRLLLFATILYMGIAVSAAIYQSQINRLRVMVRGALIGLIHHQSLHLTHDKSQSSSALTLITSDIDSIESVGETFHETWARLVEVVTGTALLASHIRWFSLLPLVIIFGCSRMSAYVAKHLENRQKDWNEATQSRIAATTSTLEGIKSLKIMGMEDAVQSQILHLRSIEIQTSKRSRWIIAAYNASANALGILAPVLTLILFAMSSKGDRLQADQIFTSLALLAMVTHPANMVMTLIPRAISVMSNFDRIQNYISQPSIQDKREYSTNGSIQRLATVQEVTIQPVSMANPILLDVSQPLDRGEILICAGAVGSGKTTLAMAILGEVSPTKGSISVSSKEIAYCAQAPWLPSVTIREAISGRLVDLDIEWYNTVIEACGLVADFDSFVGGDMALIENNGMNLSGGQKQQAPKALARAVYSKYKMLVLDDPFSALDPAVTNHIVQRLLSPRGLFRKMGTTVFLISNSKELFPIANRVLLLQNSSLHLQVQPHPQDTKASVVVSALPDKPFSSPPRHDTPKIAAPIRKLHLNDAVDEISRRTGDLAIYGYYINAIGRVNAFLLIACTAGFAFGSTFSQYVLKWATESAPESLAFYLSLYAAVSSIAWAATSGTTWCAQMKVAVKSGDVLHADLLDRILKAPLSYFTETDLGATLNRFGQDINVVDKQLPPTLANFYTQIFKMAMQLILLLKIRPVMAVTVPVCAVCVYFIQQIYLRTSRQLRFLELESRSLVFTNFLDTASGIVTIRAFGWKDKFENENVKSLDLSQKPFYILLCLQCWLKMIMDCIIAIFAVILIAFTVLYRNTTTGADLGVALNLLIVANTTLLRLVQSWTSLETSLGSIARLKSVQDCVPSEDDIGGTLDPELQWPSSGNLLVNDVSVAYSESVAPSLSNLSLTVNPGQNIIVVGRTGSGKSTFMLSLLQLLRPGKGSILIDDVNIGHLSPRTVRKRGFIAVPQDGFSIPTASLRFNLDPYHTSSDQDILWSLQRTGLWDKIHATTSLSATKEANMNIDVRSLLDLPMSSFLPFSSGQLQLFALSRTLLRIRSTAPHKPVIILDEASSSLDSETESILTDMLRHDLQGHTIVMIAHRVAGLTGAMRPGVDAIATMQDGKLLTVPLMEKSV
ncbi:ABC transporter, integral membrane type 1 [Penicillium italicum]|uniref:ABC transporter, integral membrane type 1 n=1 Tax=Penicillium italicum TaxID=40296 RepID=A0A0A2L4B9_PENIT|nr:ABC transporter, integral membrane type 1 [Penicillium italicum]